ncbi:lytic transglycosylase domain-containing protein [uncultured Bartonella sp.]|uniref:lytic transglycosylase domain-containing protein n=1 Tax=uncultured Bartonella sp. TaxID=104108 RepID=UPI00342F8AB6
MTKQRLIVSGSIVAITGCLAACTQQNKPKVELTDASSAIARVGTMTTPLSYGYLIDKKIPVPVFKELAFEGKTANPAVLANQAGRTSNGVDTSTGPVELAHASPEVEQLISKYSLAYNVPERLVRRVVKRESNGNPGSRNGPYLGLMQISHPTAKGLGYQGDPKGLLDAETNLRFAVKYLAGAYKVAEGDEAQAVRLYARGYYYDAKAKGLLGDTGPGDNSGISDDAKMAVEKVTAPKTNASTGNGTVNIPIPVMKNSGT